MGQALDNYQLDERYTRTQGRIFCTGTQALVRLLLMQKQLDQRAGLNTSGFVSGYRGSPLGSVDLEMWRAKSHLDTHQIQFQPGINEDLAATLVLGTQQVESSPDRTVDGVFALWYGKGPGVDRAGDALKHGNAYGSSPTGGVLVVVGDDHGCVSSSMPHQSDVALMSCFMPTLSPSHVGEYLEFGLYGYALSRYSGTWVGFKAVSETVESAATFDIPEWPNFNTPEDYTPPPGGLHYRWPDLPGPQIEQRMAEKVAAIQAFARANPIDRCLYNLPKASFGIITTGKAHLDLMEALRLLGIDEDRAVQLGIDIYKVGMVWPLQKSAIVQFLRGKREVLVVEEKRGIIESEMKEYLYDYDGEKPGHMLGKYDEQGDPLIPWTGELSPRLLAPLVAKRLMQVFDGLDLQPALARLSQHDLSGETPQFAAQRRPYFCSGCPHNRSTKVPEGSKALAGIGCHFMASWMDRNTESLIQMGGEGVNWAAKSRFLKKPHVFQNLGEGTWFHSGSMAIRQALAANANITYKILFNDAVAMTGGQPVDGQITVPSIAAQVRSEGVQRIAIVSDEIEKYRQSDPLPRGTTLHPREELDSLQRELRETPGVSVLIYDQVCATEKRRRRKRNLWPAAKQRVVINPEVCDNCGDCAVQSNCLSLHQIDTPLGPKRHVDQSSCNQDLSCVEGFCPSFVTLEGARPKLPSANGALANLLAQHPAPTPQIQAIPPRWDLLVVGVGGTGVITLGALITMAAHLEGRGASVLDFTGFAQKGGAVLSYIRLAESPKQLNQVRIDQAQADALIACDAVVATSPKALQTLKAEHTLVTLNTEVLPTADSVLKRDAQLEAQARAEHLGQCVGAKRCHSLTATQLALHWLGDAVFANMVLLGYSFQQGLVPVSLEALERAITLNGVAIEKNQQAFALGRSLAHDPAPFAVKKPVRTAPESLEALIDERTARLVQYHNVAMAEQYQSLVYEVQQAVKDRQNADTLTREVATQYFHLLYQKDEFEVARLYAKPEFFEQLSEQFDGPYKAYLHLAPPGLSRSTEHSDRALKWRIDAAKARPVFKLLSRFKTLRHSWLNPFALHPHRRAERQLVKAYAQAIREALPAIQKDGGKNLMAIASLPREVRGYGLVRDIAVKQALTTLNGANEPAPRAAQWQPNQP